MFDLIFQVNASKKTGVISGLKDVGNPLAYVFEDFAFPEDVPEGEITGYLIYNGRGDVEYELKDVVLESILRTGDGNVCLRDLRPEIFLMRYGDVQPAAIYRETNTQYYYRK